MAEVRLLTGTSRSGRAETIDRLLLECWNRAFLIVPTRSFAQARLAIVSGNLEPLDQGHAQFVQARDAARPITDMRGTMEYRKHLCEVLTRRALLTAIERAQEA